MYRPKERGRNQVVLFHPSNATKKQTNDCRILWACAAPSTATNSDCTTNPSSRVATGQTIGMEADDHPHRGLLDAGTFIPAAEETGLIVPIGYWVIDTAIAQVQSWRTKIPGVSPLGRSEHIVAATAGPWAGGPRDAPCRETGVPASAVHLEITESALMSDLSAVVERLVALRSLGLRLAIDDFGTGYSSWPT